MLALGAMNHITQLIARFGSPIAWGAVVGALTEAIAVTGDVAGPWGPIIGAGVLFPLSEATRVWFGGTGGAEDLMIYGALILLISVFYPGGLLALLRRLFVRAGDA